MIEALTDTLEIRLLSPDAVAPARIRRGDAGYDLRSTERVSIPPGGGGSSGPGSRSRYLRGSPGSSRRARGWRSSTG